MADITVLKLILTHVHSGQLVGGGNIIILLSGGIMSGANDSNIQHHRPEI